jgi:hypothetical protein
VATIIFLQMYHTTKKVLKIVAIQTPEILYINVPTFNLWMMHK